jgi:hypothetical protein
MDAYFQWHQRYYNENWWAEYSEQAQAIKEEMRRGRYDSDGDGVSDFLEYVFGGSPLRKDGQHLDAVGLRFKEEGLHLDYVLNIDANDVEVWIEGSNDLQQWERATGSISIEDVDLSERVPYGAELYKRVVTQPDVDYRYWRLRYTWAKGEPVER